MEADAEFVQMQTIASRLWGIDSWWHPGSMAWQRATESPSAPGVTKVWGDAAWGWMYQPDVLMLTVDPSEPQLAAEVIAWFEAGNEGSAPRVEVLEGEKHLVAALEAAGYTERLEEPFGLDLRAPAEPSGVRVPKGYRLTNAAEVTDAVRVDAHRDAWLPSALPYAPGLQPHVDPKATSSFNIEKLALTKTMPLYDPALDLVIVTDDGAPAACATVWLDPSTGAAEIEPLGVVPAHRRRGLAQVLCRATLDAVARRGGVEVVIHPRGDAAYPAPRGAYAAAGFRTVGRSRTLGRG